MDECLFVNIRASFIQSKPKFSCCRHRQPSSLSEPGLVPVLEAESATTENSGDAGALSEAEYEGAGELHPAAEKIATVCNEIKQRFQTERLNTDDENAI